METLMGIVGGNPVQQPVSSASLASLKAKDLPKLLTFAFFLWCYVKLFINCS